MSSVMRAFTYFPFPEGGLLYLRPPVSWHNVKFAQGQFRKISIFCKLKKRIQGVNFFFFFFFFFFLSFLGLHLQHMEVPRLGVSSEL